MANPNMMVSSSVASSTAPLKSVSFSALANRDVQAASDLVEGCVKEGFVYLDMSGWGEQKPVTSTWAELHSFAKLLFDVPETVKKDFDFHKVSDQKNFGYGTAPYFYPINR